MSKERFAVSGSRGFIGSRLVERLGEENVVRVERNGLVFENDLAVIYDLASYGNIHGQIEPHNTSTVIDTYQANLMRVLTEIETSDHNVPLIYVSTSSVMLPKQTFYSRSKKAAEEMLLQFSQDTSKKVAIVRPFSITGVGEQPEHLIPKLIDSCLNGTKMPFVPMPVHDWLDVDDFINALLTIQKEGELKGEIYQVGTGTYKTNQEVLNVVEEVTGAKANIEYVANMREYDNDLWVADTTRIKSLGWEPKKTLKDSVEEMVNVARNVDKSQKQLL